ncbi:MAG: class I SAM-dependent methyltransferase [Acidimicrobiales bacterium]|jgi:SAM-dependent methyltransferase
MIDPEPAASDSHSHDIFDLDAAGYEEAVDRSISFTRRDASFFARRKVALLRNILRAQGQALDQAALLDVGCGAGTTDRHLADQVKTLHGVDVSEEMLAVARKHVSGGEFVSYDGHTLPFPSGTFDVTIAICVLHHIPRAEQRPFLAELTRATRPGGVIAIFEHNPANPLTRRAVRGCELDVGVELLRAGDVERLLVAAGARVVDRSYFLFTPFGGRLGAAVDRLLRRLPLGGQHVVVALAG